jgi:hypothetical protein
MPLDELLAHLASMRLVLCWSRRSRLTLWSPNTKVPRRIRAAISQHRDELADLIAQDDIATCPAHRLHFQAWQYEYGRFICEVCRRLRMDRGV